MPVLFKVIFQLNESEDERGNGRSCLKADISSFSAELWNVESELLFQNLDVYECYRVFVDVMKDCSDRFVPYRRFGSSDLSLLPQA